MGSKHSSFYKSHKTNLISDLKHIVIQYCGPEVYLEYMKHNSKIYTVEKYKKLLIKYEPIIVIELSNNFVSIARNFNSTNMNMSHQAEKNKVKIIKKFIQKILNKMKYLKMIDFEGDCINSSVTGFKIKILISTISSMDILVGRTIDITCINVNVFHIRNVDDNTFSLNLNFHEQSYLWKLFCNILYYRIRLSLPLYTSNSTYIKTTPNGGIIASVGPTEFTH